MRRRNILTGSLADTLAGLPGLDRETLVRHWQELYGFKPGGNISRQLMIKAIAYQLQVRILGGLKPEMQALLKEALENKPPQPIKIAPPSSGIRLVREWHGVTYEVVMLDHGVFYNNQTYKSLTEVANLITGGKWSGPRFFGLKKAAI